MPTTPQALNAELLARIVQLERQIVALEAELAQHHGGPAATLLATIATTPAAYRWMIASSESSCAGWLAKPAWAEDAGLECDAIAAELVAMAEATRQCVAK